MTLLARARFLAERTPPTRNRAADFLRAAAIVMVVLGHWLVSAPHFDGRELTFAKLLTIHPWTLYATWAFQVMPIFFLVGGYSNAASWASARQHRERRKSWQATRLKRLLTPTIPLVIFWCLAAGLAGKAGLETDIIRDASRAALIPIWFLAVYIMVTVAVPVSFAIWERFGLLSVAALALTAVCIDLMAFAGDVHWVRWLNYGFIWLAMHQLGYWWRRGVDGKIGPGLLLAIGVFSLAMLIGLLDYPVAMVSVPGAEVSNSRPPTVAMLSLGFAQAGLILLLADFLSRWLLHLRRWALVILISQRIMTVYLWHSAALLVLIALSLLIDGVGLTSTPGSGAWWLWRPAWIAALLVVLAPLVFLFGKFEASSRRSMGALPGSARAVIGAILACGGLTMLALGGAYADNFLGVNLIPALSAVVGALLATSARRTQVEKQ